MYVYVLTDELGEIRYVGATRKTSVEKRLKSHLWVSELKKDTHKAHWVNSMVSRGLTPTIVGIQKFTNTDDMYAAEKYWIATLKERGCRLVNATAGGEGVTGKSPETRAKIGAKHKGKKLTQAHKDAVGNAHKGVPQPLAKTIDNWKHHGGRVFQDQDGTLYWSVKKAARQLGFHENNIRRVLKGAGKQTHGMVFSYVNAETEAKFLEELTHGKS